MRTLNRWIIAAAAFNDLLVVFGRNLTDKEK